MTANVKLLPCPFCGREVVRDFVNDSYTADISCAECGESFRMSEEQWNKRSPLEEAISAVTKIAGIAHAGGLNGMTEHDALNAIRNVSLPWWNKEKTTKQQALTQQEPHT